CEAGEGVEHRVDVGGYVETQVAKVVASVDDDRQALAEELRQTQRQLGAADAAAERDITPGGSGVGQVCRLRHRKRSIALGRIRSAAGRSGACQSRPRTSAAGVASAASPITSTAPAATASAKAASVTFRARPEGSRPPPPVPRPGT